MAIERIVDGVNLNNFGVLFHSTKAIEEFQKRSGMEGSYTTEYQHHYVALIARLEAENQTLDIAIPMCMYNYHQEVGGASVEFNMGEVGEANNEAMVKAVEKFNEFETTDMYKSLVSMGFLDFKLEGLHSIHAHPSGVNRFSGTDLRADIKHPGVNFPLSVGEDVANFASIIQHKEGFAEIIHTEYRMFNGEENDERKYEKGRTLTVVKGYDLPEPEPWVEPEPGIIDQLFGTKPPPPPKPAIPKKRPSYFLSDGFANADEAKFTAIKDELMNMWIPCEFEIDVSLVLKTNVLKGRGRLLTQGKQGHSWDGYWAGGNTRGKRQEEEAAEGLFAVRNGHETEDEPPAYKMKQYLVANCDFSWPEVHQLEIEEVRNLYWMERLDELEDEKVGVYKNDHESTFTPQEYINMLVSDNIMTREKLNMLSTEDLKELVVEIYGTW